MSDGNIPARTLSRRQFMRVASLGLAVAALLTPLKRLVPGQRQRTPEKLPWPKGSLFRPRLGK